jgi:D-glycero-D-manno-heptose 1,7-bisphosphate phosphatase
MGCQPMLVLTGKGEKTQEDTLPENTLVFADLAAAVNHILAGEDE